jgi:hypothetical protein
MTDSPKARTNSGVLSLVGACGSCGGLHGARRVAEHPTQRLRGGLEGSAQIRPDPGVQRLEVTHDLPDSHDESMHFGPRHATLCTLTTS